jgi:hypothetical protein
LVSYTAAAARSQRRSGREKKRANDHGSWTADGEASPGGDAWGEVTAGEKLVPDRAIRPPRGAAALVGAAVGFLAGVAVGKMRNRGNEISGDVAVHLLNRIELLTIRFQVRQAQQGGPAEVAVHRVHADASSRP